MSNIDDIYTIIVAAKAETAAAFAQVSGEMRTMVAEITQQTRLAEASLTELEAHTGQLGSIIANTAAAARQHGSEIASGLGIAAREVSTSFGAVEQDLKRFKTAMMDAAIVALPIALIGGEALKMAGDYEAAFLKIKGLTAATPEDLAMWKPAILDMSMAEKGTQSAKELSEAMFFVSSTQLHGADALHVLDVAAAGATGGLGKLDALAQVLGGSLNAYVNQAERAAKATQYMDQITTAVVQGHMDPAGLAPQISRIAPQAASMNMPFGDVLAMISTGTHVGMGSDQAVTGSNAILQSLGAPKATVAKTLTAIGIDPDTMGTRIEREGMEQTLADIRRQIDLTSGGDQDKRNMLERNLFPASRTGRKMFDVLTRTGGDINDEGDSGDSNFYKTIGDQITNHSAGATEFAKASALEGFNAQMQILRNNVDAVGIAFGSALIPTLTPLVKDLVPALVSNLVQFANDAMKAGAAILGIAQGIGQLAGILGVTITPLQLVEALLVALGAMAVVSAGAAIVTFGLDIGALILSLSLLVFELGAAAVGFLAMGAAALGGWMMAGGPITLIVLGLIALVSGLALAWANDWGNIREIVGGAVDWIKEKLFGLLDLIASNQMTSDFFHVPADWREQWGAVADTVKGAVGGAATAAGSATSGIGDSLNSAIQAASGAKDQVTAAIAQIRGSFDKLQGPNAISLNAKTAVDQALKDIQAAAAASGQAVQPGTSAPLTADTVKVTMEKELLDLKKQALDVEGQMLVPQQHLADLQAQMKEAAREQLKLADDARLLALDASTFNQSADLKRTDLKIAQLQDKLTYEKNPAVAGEYHSEIEALKRQAFGLRQGMFGADTERLEAQITQSGDTLGTKINQNALQQQIALLNEALVPLEAHKKAIGDATSLVQHQQAIDALQTKIEPRGPAGGGIPIVDRSAPTTTTTAEAAPPVAPPTRDDWASSPVVVQKAYQIDFHNPTLSSDMDVNSLIAYLHKGLEEADAAGNPTPAVGSEVS